MVKNNIDESIKVLVKNFGRDVAEFYVAYAILEFLNREGSLKKMSDQETATKLAAIMMLLHNNLDMDENNTKLLIFMKKHFNLYEHITSLINNTVDELNKPKH